MGLLSLFRSLGSPAATTKRPIVFVGNTAVASTELRGRQLATIAMRSPRLADHRISFSVSANSPGAILFLTKGAASRMSPIKIEKLRKKGSIVFADFLDRAPNPDMLSQLDGLIASSLRQLEFYRSAYPDLRSCLVTHHADLRIGAIAPPSDRLRVGYFGELFNARFHDELKDVIDFVKTDTQKLDPQMLWLDRLRDYNAHYLVRQKHPSDHFKPFTKGFVAARCGAPVIVERTEGDADDYLPSDYPYFVDDPTPAGIRDVVARMKSDFGRSPWFAAREAMERIKERSSPEFIADELASAFLPYL